MTGRKVRMTICSGCLSEFADNDLYEVYKGMNWSDSTNGFYRTPYCVKCIKRTESYHTINKEPKNKLNKK